MRWPILAALLLCACAHLDASDRERQRLAWQRCTTHHASTWLSDCY